MASYVVMEPPVRDGAERAVLVRDGFHFLAFVFPVFWLLFHRLWLEALAVFAVGLAIGAVASYLDYDWLALVAGLAVAIFIGLEGPALKVAALLRRGWREWGVVEADNSGDAEVRYLEAKDFNGQDDTVPALQTNRPARAAATAVPALGMLGYPGRG